MLVEFVLWAALGLILGGALLLGPRVIRGFRHAAAVLDEVAHLDVSVSLDIDEEGE